MEVNGPDGNEEFQCRICASYVTDKNGRMHIFDEDARRNYLQTKIRKYLYLVVSSDDRLPKMMCAECIKKLEGIHRFATMAHRAQERLKTQFHGTFDDEDKLENNEFNNGEVEKTDRGLLRSILIAREHGKEDINSMDLSSMPIRTIDEDSNQHNTTEEMEVKVDPMIFLQCDLDRSESPEMSESNSDCDERSNHIKDSFDSEDIRRTCKSPERYSDEQDPSSESSTKSYGCTICTRSFGTQMSLQNHLWSHLPRSDHQYDEKPVQENIQNSVLHQDNDSNGYGNSGGSFVCPICNKRISTKGNLKVHLETHRPKGKYGCDICGRIFKTQSNLFRHKEYHGGIQFPCSVCGRVYPTNSTLRAHSITHSDLRPHACPLCDKTFKRNQDLKFHINQHTGARPYQCPYCPKAFASSGNCFSHRKRMHPREVHRDRQRAADLMR